MYLFFSRSFRKWSSPLALSGDIVFSMIHIFTFSSVQNVSMIVPHVAFVGYEGSLSLYINTNFSVEKSSGILICGRHELNFCGGRILCNLWKYITKQNTECERRLSSSARFVSFL